MVLVVYCVEEELLNGYEDEVTLVEVGTTVEELLLV